MSGTLRAEEYTPEIRKRWPSGVNIRHGAQDCYVWNWKKRVRIAQREFLSSLLYTHSDHAVLLRRKVKQAR
jgi:hypothetical protein